MPQGRHGEFEPDKAHSTVVGIICPPLVGIGLTVTKNLGKARALQALVAVAALRAILIIDSPTLFRVDNFLSIFSKKY